MAATIPADTLQFYGVSLRMAQELAYLFGHKDLWADNTCKHNKEDFCSGNIKSSPNNRWDNLWGIDLCVDETNGYTIRDTLYQSVDNYTIDDLNRDFQEMKKEIPDIIDAEFTNIEVEIGANKRSEIKEKVTPFSVADEILKFKQLLDMGALTQEEFERKSKNYYFLN